MPLRLLRSVLCIAALLAGLALVMPAGQASWVAPAVALTAVASLALLRVAKGRRAGERDSSGVALAAASLRPDFDEAAAEIAVACRDAASFDDALRDVAAVLKGEIGARDVRVYRVAAAEDQSIRLTEMPTGDANVQRPDRCLDSHDFLLATAIRQGRPLLASPERALLPVSIENAVTTVIELGGVELEMEPEALVRLLDHAGSALGELAVADRETRRPETSEPPVPASGLIGRRILLLEPDMPVCASLRPTLQRLGANVIRVTSGEAVRRASGETQFDLLLADVDAGWCATDLPSGVARIAVSTQAQPAGEAALLARGFDAVLCRSCSESQLLAMLTRHLRVAVLQPAAHTAVGAPPLTPSLLDAVALAKLAELDPTGENQLLQRVLRAYETSVARLMPMFEDARRRGDLTGMRHVAHTLKSSSASIGAIKFSEHCAEIETMIRLQSTEALNARADELCAELESVLQAVRQMLGGRP